MRVLQVIGVMDRGGAETMVMNLYRAIDREKIQFDFLVHEQREGDYDAEIVRLGGRIFRVPRYTGLNAISYRRTSRSLRRPSRMVRGAWTYRFVRPVVFVRGETRRRVRDCP